MKSSTPIVNSEVSYRTMYVHMMLGVRIEHASGHDRIKNKLVNTAEL